MATTMGVLRLRTRSAAAAIFIATALAFAPLSQSPADGLSSIPVPAGYRIVAKENVTRNIVWVQYRSSSPLRVVNVAFLVRGAGERFRMVVGGDRVWGAPGTETVSSMCRRVACKIAVNGDYYSLKTGEPVGGIAYDGLPLRSPPGNRYHFTVGWDGTRTVQKIGFPVYLTTSTKKYLVHGYNHPRANDRAILYSAAWSPSTRTPNTSSFELILKVINTPTTLDKVLKVQIAGGRAGGNTTIPPGALVLSGSGIHSTLFSQLWRNVQNRVTSNIAEINLDAVPNLRMFTGGNPALLLGGKLGFTSDGSSYYTARNPRTMVGVNGTGDAILAVVDGRQPSWSVGVNMTEAAALMKSLGAVQALNLDAGGSSTFVKNGVVVNRPSDGRERSVGSALAIIG
jgi:hypothetical protein